MMCAMLLSGNDLLATYPSWKSGKFNLLRNLFALLAIPAGVGMFLGGPLAKAQNAYITNNISNTVSVIDTATNKVIGSPIDVGGSSAPSGVAVSPDGNTVYVTLQGTVFRQNGHV